MSFKTGNTFLDRMETFFRDVFWRPFRIKPLIIFYLIASVFLIRKTEKYAAWTTSTPFSSDIDQYYSYLPQIFIHHDPGFTNATRYWAVAQPNGNKIQRFTIGIAVMEFPFFVLAHCVAPFYDYPQDGYSAPYIWLLYVGMVFYVFVGLYCVYRSLRFFYGDWFSVCMIAVLFFATNLFYYTASEGLMSHSFLFFLQSAFIFNVLSWYRSGKLKHILLFSFFGGMAVLSRPTEVLILIFPMLLGLKNITSLSERFKFWNDKKFQIVIGILIFILVLMPQLLYWKTYSGKWLFYSYGDEGFFFNDPKLLQFWFGFRKGLIPYAPIFIFSIIGFFFLWKNSREMFFAILIFTVLNSYVLSSWWDYGYGGSLGNRALVQSYASLIFPLAAFFQWFLNFPNKLRYKLFNASIFVVVIYFLINLNLIMSLQYRQTIIHWNGMNKEAYWFVFMKEEFTADDFKKREELIEIPDYSKMIKGERN